MKSIGCSLAALLQCAGAAHAADVTHPDWARRPDGEAMSRAYPLAAMALRIEARGTVECKVNATGKLKDCVVTSHEPKGFGFDRALLQLTTEFQMRPKTVDGQPVDGGTVRIPLRFMMRPAPEPAPNRPLRLTAAGERLAEALQPAALATVRQYNRFRLADVQAAATGPDPEPLTVETVAALDAAFGRHEAEMARRLSRLTAGSMTDTSMAEASAFAASPAGAAYLRRLGDFTLIQARAQAELMEHVTTNARRTFCGAAPCPPAAPSLEEQADDAIWERRPSTEDLAQSAPEIDGFLRLGGWARLSCLIGRRGSPEECLVLEESPAGLGFGEAAREVAGLYKVSADASSVMDGERARLLLAFTPTPHPPSTVFGEPGPRSSDPAAIALARELLQADAAVRGLNEDTIKPLQAMDLPPGPRADAVQKLIGLLRQFQKDLDTMSAALAAETAALFTREELTALVAYRRANGDLPNFAGSEQVDLEALWAEPTEQAVADARRVVCATRACPAPAKGKP